MTQDTLATLVGFARGAGLQRMRILQRKIRASTLGGTDQPPRKPIFIVGSPRSGTTLLFHLLRRHEDIWALPSEGHTLWNAYQHPRLKGWSSDRATPQDIAPRERRYLYTAINALAGSRRFLDKTPKNVLKVPYLAELFPDASFVFIKRDGRATVASLIEGWRARRGLSYRLPVRLRLADYDGRLWSYILPPGWRELMGTSVAEVAAAQYARSCQAALQDRERVPGSFVEIAYEDLVARPVPETAGLLERLDLPGSDRTLDFARHLDRYRAGAITPPRPDKWRERADEIARVLPTIAPVMAEMGYRSEAIP